MKKIIITASAVLIAAGCVVALWMSMRPTVTFLVNGKEADLHCSIDVEYENGMRVYLVPFTKVQTEIHEKCPEGLGTLITRRFMMRIAERLARKFGALALITGESLGQVASQTMEAITCTDAVVGMPVFRPLIGMDKLEITEIAEKIGTYETSNLP